MRNLLDFSSWSTLLTTLMGLLVATLVMVGTRLVFMQTIQKRRERENRQINERLKTLIAAYKTLGGSFTGQLQVHPTHMRDLHRQQVQQSAVQMALADGRATEADESEPADAVPSPTLTSTERQRRVRDAVEAALSDVILLGTEEQVELAAKAAQDMVAGRSIETAQLVVSLRHFIRAALDLEPIPAAVDIPNQGPLRPAGSGGAAGKRAGGSGNAEAGGGRGGGAGGGGSGGAGMGGMALGVGVGTHRADGDTIESPGR